MPYLTALLLTCTLLPRANAKKNSVERRPVRSLTEDVGLQSTRMNKTVKSLAATGGGKADCPEVAALKGPDLPAEVAPEPKYTDVLAENGRVMKLSVVPKSMLPKIYEVMKQRNFDKKTGETDPPMAFGNSCLCVQRTHYLGDKLARKLNLETGKLMVTAQAFGNPLARDLVPTLPNGQRPSWPRHLTNFVMVDEGDGKPPVPYALDVSLFPDAPVPVETWKKAFKGVGDGGWTDAALGKARVTMSNRYAFSPADRYADLTSYPRDDSGDARSLGRTSQFLNDNYGLQRCLGHR